jgi:hypothetical protein
VPAPPPIITAITRCESLNLRDMRKVR